MLTTSTENERRALRVKHVKQMLGITSKGLSDCSGIPVNTIRAWEAVSRGTLTIDGAHRLCTAFINEGIECSAEWLLYGEGPGPTKFTYGDISALSAKAEANAFEKAHRNTVIHVINDIAMLPFYKEGSIVGGIWSNDIPTVSSELSHYILDIESHGILCRRFQVIEKQNIANCFPTNISYAAGNLFKVKILRAAKIIRHWQE